MKKMIAAVFAGVISFAAYAEENPLRFDASACMLDASGTLSIQTLPMPKGWFTSKGAFDRTKTDLRTTYSLSTTSCEAGAGEATISSTTVGTLSVLNPQEKEIAYVWNMIGDLSANQNHWWYFHGCQGEIVKMGCDQPRDATFAVAAYGKDGQCRTFVNDSGVTTCAGDTVVLQLASVQDPDQHVDPALCQADECGIGPCVSERVKQGGFCDTSFPVNMQLDPNSKANNPKYYDANESARSACKSASVCFCKALRPAACNDGGKDCE